MKNADSFLFQLPAYSKAGRFHLSILNKNQEELVANDARTSAEAGNLKLLVRMDISRLPAGEYRLALRSDQEVAPYFYHVRIQ